MNELLVIENKPEIPNNWNYEKSVKKVKQVFYKWKNITGELAKEFYIARYFLSSDGRPKTGTNVPVKNWNQYCVDIGTERRTVNRWLERYFPINNSEEKLNRLLAKNNEILPTNITLLEGDIFEKIKEINDKSIDLLITDPPYMVMGDYEWDKKDSNFLCEWLQIVKPKLKDNYAGFVFCDARKQFFFESIIREFFEIKNRLIWIRKNMSMGRVVKDRFISSYEVIFYFGNRELNFPEKWGEERFDSFEYAVPQSNFNEGKYHPTQKPLELFKRLIELGSKEGELVADIFAGSGTTGLACKEMNRNCVLIEKEREYINIIKNRL